MSSLNTKWNAVFSLHELRKLILVFNLNIRLMQLLCAVWFNTHLNGCLPRCLVILSKRVFKKFAQSIAGSLCRDVTIKISSIPYASPVTRNKNRKFLIFSLFFVLFIITIRLIESLNLHVFWM